MYSPSIKKIKIMSNLLFSLSSKKKIHFFS